MIVGVWGLVKQLSPKIKTASMSLPRKVWIPPGLSGQE